ncbi:hypothetical protein [Neorhodopirellula lusitana]|nr:hypothetical protein [Neorhodopirellula lusitana]
MTAISASIAHPNPPNWIVTLAETGFEYQAHTTLTVTESAVAIAILGDAHDGPLSCNLNESQNQRLTTILSGCKRSTVYDHDSNVLDGILGVVAVVNATQSWCSFSEFNLFDPPPNSQNCGLLLGRFIRDLHRELWSIPSGP